MYNMKAIVFTIMITLFQFSCIEKSNKAQVLNIDKNTDQTTLDQIYNEFECISLETNEECIFGSINQLILFDNKFFILDMTRMKKIFVYEQDGSFSHTIGKVGNGPGEYTNIEDFTIDEKNKHVVILTYPSTVFVYNLNGDFVLKKQLSTSSMFWSIESFSDGYVCSTNQQSALNDSLLHFYDKNFVLTHTLLKPLSFQITMPPFVTNPIQKEKKQLYYFDSFTATMYSNISNKTEHKATLFNIGEQMEPEIFKDVQQFFEKQMEYSFFNDVIIADNVLYATFFRKGEACDLVYDLNTQKINVSKAIGWRPVSLLYHEGYFYSSVNPSVILDDNKYFKAKLSTKFPITFDSNPMILRYKANNKH